jgi:hypothetical protein
VRWPLEAPAAAGALALPDTPVAAAPREESDAAVAEVIVTLLGEGLHRAERQRELMRD